LHWADVFVYKAVFADVVQDKAIDLAIESHLQQDLRDAMAGQSILMGTESPSSLRQ